MPTAGLSQGAEAAAAVDASEEVADIVAESAWAAVVRTSLNLVRHTLFYMKARSPFTLKL